MGYGHSCFLELFSYKLFERSSPNLALNLQPKVFLKETIKNKITSLVNSARLRSFIIYLLIKMYMYIILQVFLSQSANFSTAVVGVGSLK